MPDAGEFGFRRINARSMRVPLPTLMSPILVLIVERLLVSFGLGMRCRIEFDYSALIPAVIKITGELTGRLLGSSKRRVGHGT
jgi:hypothetical protein